MKMYREGRLCPHVGATLPLSRSAEALELLKNRSVAGKIVVTVDA
jgi:NADPH2:quinone reductase